MTPGSPCYRNWGGDLLLHPPDSKETSPCEEVLNSEYFANERILYRYLLWFFPIVKVYMYAVVLLHR